MEYCDNNSILTLNAPWLYSLLQRSVGKALILMLPNEWTSSQQFIMVAYVGNPA